MQFLEKCSVAKRVSLKRRKCKQLSAGKMGNNQGGFHKRERTGDGTQGRSRQWASGSSGQTMSTSTEDGCPVQACFSICFVKGFHLYLLRIDY